MNRTVIQLELANGAYTGCRVAGTGPIPVVLLHGYSMSLEVWDRVLDRVPASWTAYAYDLRGFGSAAWAASYGPEAHVADLLKAIERLQLDRPVLIGHSMGANLLQDFAVQNPGRFRALVLSNAAARISPPSDPVAARVAERIALYGSPDVNRLILRSRLPDYFSPETISMAELDRFAKLGSRADPIALREMLTSSYNTPALPAESFAAVTTPVLLIGGEHDGVTPASAMQALQLAMPQSLLVTLPDCGHTPMWETTAAWLNAVLAFLETGQSHLTCARAY